MKKWMSILLLLMTGILLTACQNNEEPLISMEISLTGLKGEGTLTNPYQIQVFEGEPIYKPFTYDTNYQLEITSGIITKGKFVKNNDESSSVSIQNGYLLMKSLNGESHVICIHGKDTSTNLYIEVNVMTYNLNKPLRVLAIGNSFSEDAMTYLYDIAKSAGIEEVKIGYLYSGGAPLEKHDQNFTNGTAYEKFMINFDGTWKNDLAIIGKTAIIKYDWDIITLQQASGLSGLSDTYEPYISNLTDIILNTKLSKTEFVWHQTWAYSQNSTHVDFVNYDRSQTVMFNGILNAVKTVILPNQNFTNLIPAGSLIQALREASIPETSITRDGFHLNLILGRYAAALMWYKSLTGLPLDLVTFVPQDSFGKSLISEENLTLIKTLVDAIYANPLGMDI